MTTPESPTYVLKYTPKTLTAIARSEKAGPVGQNVQYDVDVTTVEAPSVLSTAKGWRTISEDDGDLFIVEIEPGAPTCQFILPFTHAVIFADEEQENLSSSRRLTP